MGHRAEMIGYPRIVTATPNRDARPRRSAQVGPTAPQDPDGTPDGTRGIVEIVAGTGGAEQPAGDDDVHGRAAGGTVSGRRPWYGPWAAASGLRRGGDGQRARHGPRKLPGTGMDALASSRSRLGRRSQACAEP